MKNFILFVLLLLIAKVRLQNQNEKKNLCAYLHCNENEVCVHRKFRCRNPPCPGMLYCAKSRTESLRGPSTCDNVLCTSGHVCMLKVRGCRWDEMKCEQQIARCVSRKEYDEGPASCVGFKCPQGRHCILRESFCVRPPCKLLKSCGKNKDVHVWFGKCRHLGCPSEFECFLRKPENTCLKPPCKHTPDCVTTTGDEITNEHCRGWICPRPQKCSAKIVGNCELDECSVERTCQEVSSNYSVINTKVPWNNSQETNEKIKTPHSWLNHLKSTTELDAIELWIKNAEGQRDFKQFQDWLQSVKDILGPGAYSHWLEEILSSRGEEFRKWLRASHVDKLDSEKPIFPGGDRPQDQAPHVLTENRYPDVLDTLTTPSENSSTKNEENFLANEKNITSVIENLLISNKILETALLDNLRQSNRSPFLDYILKYPLHAGELNLSSLLPKNKNMYEQPYFVFPVGHIKVTESSMFDDQDSRSHGDSPNQNGRRVQNGETLGRGNIKHTNVSELSRNLTVLEEKIYEDFKKTQEEKHNIENPVSLPEDIKLLNKNQYFDEISTDALEKLIKSFQFSSMGDVHHTFNDKPFGRYEQNIPPEIVQNGGHYRNENEKTDHRNKLNNQTSTENPKRFIYNNKNDNFSPHLESNISLDGPGNIHTLNHSDQLSSIYSPEAIFKQINDDNMNEMDLKLLLELNKENYLPYIQNIMDAMNEENTSLINGEPNQEETLMKHSFLKDNNLRSANDASDKSISEQITWSNASADKKLYNLNATYDSGFLKHKKFGDSHQSTMETVSSGVKQQNDSRTTGLIYTDQEPTIRSFYSPPSYGASNTDIGDGDYKLETNGEDYVDKDDPQSVADYINRN
nr:PREDICTED: uncharacterized protein LOC100877256 [Megachile rotundata]